MKRCVGQLSGQMSIDMEAVFLELGNPQSSVHRRLVGGVKKHSVCYYYYDSFCYLIINWQPNALLMKRTKPSLNSEGKFWTILLGFEEGEERMRRDGWMAGMMMI